MLSNKPNVDKYDMLLDLELLIASKLTGEIIKPLVIDKVELTRERKDTPAKLTFKMLFDSKIREGDQVSVRYKGVDAYLGYIFTRKLDKENIVSVTCYDQLRYLKSKAFYLYENVSISGIIKKIAEDFKLKIGDIEDTGHVFETRREDGTTLIDQIQGAISETLRLTGKRYILYDDYGKLTLKETENLKLEDIILDAKSAENFDFEVSIDKNTYNQVVLDYVNEKEKKLDKYQVLDSENIGKWGILQYFEKIDRQNNASEVERKERAEKMLKYYNRKTKDFKLKNVFGDIRVIGGSSFKIILNVGEYKIANYMLVDKVKHSWTYKEYTMDLDLEGEIKEEVVNVV